MGFNPDVEKWDGRRGWDDRLVHRRVTGGKQEEEVRSRVNIQTAHDVSDAPALMESA